MNTTYKIKGLRYLLWWIASSLFVWPMSIVLGAVVLVPVGVVANAFTAEVLLYEPFGYYEMLMLCIVVPLLGAVLGFTVGQLQHWLLRNYLYWTAERWRRYSTLGGVIGAVIVMLLGLFAPNEDSPLVIPLAMTIFVACVSAVQYLSLRQAVRSAWLWVLANIIGGIVFGGLLVMNEPSHNIRHYFNLMMLLWLMATSAQGFITGYVMLFLFEKKSYEMVPAHETADSNSSDSVWDNAI